MTESFQYRPDKILDQLVDAICVVDSSGCFVYVNAACERLFGYTQEELIGKNMIDLVYPDDRERTLQTASEIMRGQPSSNFENRYVRKDGNIVHIMWSARWSESDRVRLAVARDITELKHNTSIQHSLYQILEAVYVSDDISTLYKNIHQIIGTLVPAGNFYIALYDLSSGVLSFPYFVDEQELLPDPAPMASGTPIASVIQQRQSLLTNKMSFGAITSAEITGANESYDWLGVPLLMQNGLFGAMVVQQYAKGKKYTREDLDRLQLVSMQVTNAIERKQTEIRLRHMAGHDALTNLPNRTLFQDRFDMALKRARRDKEFVSLLYLDLDGFKFINDTYGHEIGDQVLCELANRLKLCVREADTIGRRGGDEFTVLLTNIRNADTVDTVVNKIRRSISIPFEVNGHTLTISASIGTSVYPEQGMTPEQLFHHADTNMYSAKRGE